MSDNFKVEKVKKCSRVYYNNLMQSWHAFNVKTVKYASDGKQILNTSFQEQIKIKINPKKLIKKQRQEDSSSLVKISSQISDKEESGSNAVSLVATWHAKLAYLLSSFLFALCGFNLAFVNTQRRKKSVLIFLPYMLLAIGYWSFYITFKSLAIAGEIKPIIGAWSANFFLVLYIVFQFQANKKENGLSLVLDFLDFTT